MQDKPVFVIAPPKDTQGVDVTDVPTLVIGFSAADMRRVPKSIAKRAYLHVCSRCLGNIWTKVDYQGQSVQFIGMDCLEGKNER